jgi:hypothetical protein
MSEKPPSEIHESSAASAAAPPSEDAVASDTATEDTPLSFERLTEICNFCKTELQMVSSKFFEDVPVEVSPKTATDASQLLGGLCNVDSLLLSKFELVKQPHVLPTPPDSVTPYYNAFIKSHKDKNSVLVVMRISDKFLELVPLDVFEKKKRKIEDFLKQKLRNGTKVHANNKSFLDMLEEYKQSDQEFLSKFKDVNMRYNWKAMYRFEGYWEQNFQTLKFLGYMGPNDFDKKFTSTVKKITKSAGPTNTQDRLSESVQSVKTLGDSLFKVVEETAAQQRMKQLRTMRDSLLKMQSGSLFGVELNAAHLEHMLRGFLEQTKWDDADFAERDKDLAVLTMDVHWLATERLSELLEQTQDPSKPCVLEFRDLFKEEEQAYMQFIFKVHNPSSKIPSQFSDFLDQRNFRLPLSVAQAMIIDGIVFKYAKSVATAKKITRVPDDFDKFTPEDLLKIIQQNDEPAEAEGDHSEEDVVLTCLLAYKFFNSIWPLETVDDPHYLDLYLKCWCHPMLRPLASAGCFVYVATMAREECSLREDLDEPWGILVHHYKSCIQRRLDQKETEYNPVRMHFAPSAGYTYGFPYHDKKAFVKARR